MGTACQYTDYEYMKRYCQAAYVLNIKLQRPNYVGTSNGSVTLGKLWVHVFQ